MKLEARAGIEPAHGSFADSCVTTSPTRQCELLYQLYPQLSTLRYTKLMESIMHVGIKLRRQSPKMSYGWRSPETSGFQ